MLRNLIVVNKVSLLLSLGDEASEGRRAIKQDYVRPCRCRGTLAGDNDGRPTRSSDGVQRVRRIFTMVLSVSERLNKCVPVHAAVGRRAARCASDDAERLLIKLLPAGLLCVLSLLTL